MKTVKIKGKDYVLVKDRILFLAENYKGKYSIDTDATYYSEQRMWVVRAVLIIDGQRFTGWAQEIESDNYRDVNFSSALENCETSSIGRACAMAGIGVLDSIASADEMIKAKNRLPQAAKEEWDGRRRFNFRDKPDGVYTVVLDEFPTVPKKVGKNKEYTAYDTKIVVNGELQTIMLFDNEVKSDFPKGISSAKEGDTITITKKGNKRMFVKQNTQK